MIIFVAGEDAFSVKNHVHAMRERFVEKFDASGMNVEVFLNNKTHQIGAIVAAASAPGFLSDRRMVIVHGLLSQVTRKPDAKPWIAQLSNIPKDNILILVDSISEKKFLKHSLYLGLSKEEAVHVYRFPALSAFAAEKKIMELSKEQSINLDPSVARELVAFVGTDLWQLSNELQKIASYADGRNVSKEDIQLLVTRNTEDAMFDFIDAISKRNAKQAAKLLEDQRLSGTSDFQLVAMLARQARLLLGAAALAKRGEGSKQTIAKELGVHPFVAQKISAQIRMFNYEDLSHIHEMLVTYDFQLKHGEIDARTAVDRLFSAFLSSECLTK